MMNKGLEVIEASYLFALTPDEIDVLAVHIRPRDVWYVLPVEVVALAKNLRFYPDIECKCARWESYREAWSVMGVE